MRPAAHDRPLLPRLAYSACACHGRAPTIGRREYALHPDANALAGLWARMLLERIESVPLDTVKPAVRTAFDRWLAALICRAWAVSAA